MKQLIGVSVQIGFLLAGGWIRAQPLRQSTVPYFDESPRPPKEIHELIDTEEHRVALSREIANERGPDGNLNVLKACSDVGIICGLELSPKMSKILNGFMQKNYTLHSLFRGVLGNEARVTWVLQDHAARQTAAGFSPLYVLSIRPKRGGGLDKVVVWNVAMSGGAKRDAYDLSKMIGLDVEKPASLVRLHVGIIGDAPVRMSARDALNHIAAKTDTSWQVIYSSGSKIGKLSIYSGNK